MDIIKVSKILRKHFLMIVGVFALAMVLVALAPTPQVEAPPTMYQSQAKVLLTPPNGGFRGFATGSQELVDMNATAYAWFADPVLLQEIMQSEELLKRVHAESGMKGEWIELRSMIAMEPMSFNGQGIKLFKLTVTSDDPKESQKIARSMIEEFGSYTQELSAKEFASTRKFVEELVVEADQRRLQSEENLAILREKYLGIPSDEALASQQSTLEQQRREYDQKIPSLQAELSSLRAYMDGSVSSPPWEILQQGNSSLKSLESHLSESELKLTQAKEIYTDQSDHVKKAATQVQKAREAYDRGVRDYVSSLSDSKTRELSNLTSNSQVITQQLTSLLAGRMTPEDRRTLQKLERERTLWEENHFALVQQLYNARVTEQSSRRQGSVNTLEQPMAGSPVANPTRTKAAMTRGKRVAVAIPFCLVLALGAAMLREHLSSSMKLRPRIEEALELPVIAVIPASPSNLTVEWERFKRPLIASAKELVSVGGGSSHNGNGTGYSNGQGNGVHANDHSNGLPKSDEPPSFRRPE